MEYRIGRDLGSGAIGRVVEVHGEDGRVWAGKISRKLGVDAWVLAKEVPRVPGAGVGAPVRRCRGRARARSPRRP